MNSGLATSCWIYVSLIPSLVASLWANYDDNFTIWGQELCQYRRCEVNVASLPLTIGRGSMSRLRRTTCCYGSIHRSNGIVGHTLLKISLNINADCYSKLASDLFLRIIVTLPWLLLCGSIMSKICGSPVKLLRIMSWSSLGRPSLYVKWKKI